jgi:hypothetical protein
MVEMKLRHVDGEVMSIACERKQGVSTPVSFYLQAPSTGYIKLREFNALAGRDVAAAVTELTAKGADRFVLDLRDNPGGLVQVRTCNTHTHTLQTCQLPIRSAAVRGRLCGGGVTGLEA